MSNLSQRLRKLEPAPEHQDYLAEVGRRLMRYGIETRYQVKAGKLPECAWGPREEKHYQRWAENPEFASIEREILANPSYSGGINAR